ncbi:GatB/YqeY domain-containing protein [Patescibacteria group bacterium]
MSLKDRIEADYRKAFKSKQTEVMSALRLLKAAVKNAEIAKRKDFEDDEVEKVINQEAKKVRDSIEAYQQGNRQDLVKQEEAQLKVMEDYLPEQLSPEELKDIVHDVINRLQASRPQDMGRVMKEIMSVTEGQADGKQVKELVQSFLTSNQDNSQNP